ncbi:MAG TPA: xanthine dehydrogenase family protein subunit M [Candidatus Dormibacteraeota bacterium]|nr:xanthine dehydrogenase family protein subunit M [Candidatus Dormibacteraeota bacterium]
MRYLRPGDLQEALELLAEHGEAAKVLAGGQSLLVLLREHLVEPEFLIGLSGIEGLRRLEVNGGARIGAMVTHAEVERDPRIAARWPILAQAEAAVSTIQIRNRGTLCGNVAHAFPTADPPAALIACDARVHLASKAGGEREVEARDFFTGVMETVARPDELVTALSLPPQPEGARGVYLKYAVRPLDFAIVGVAVRVVVGPVGTIEDVRIGLNGAADRPLRAVEAEAVLAGQVPSRELLVEAARTAARHSDPLDEVDGSAAYRRRCVAVYTRRALERVLGMEGG